MGQKSSRDARLCGWGFAAWESLTPDEVCAVCLMEEDTLPIHADERNVCPCSKCIRGGRRIVADERGRAFVCHAGCREYDDFLRRYYGLPDRERPVVDIQIL